MRNINLTKSDRIKAKDILKGTLEKKKAKRRRESERDLNQVRRKTDCPLPVKSKRFKESGKKESGVQ